MKTQRHWFFVLSCLIAIVAINTNTYAAVDKAWLDNKIKTFIEKKPVNGMIYGLWINGKPVSVNAIGLSMTNTPATIDMHFRIGGVTETILTTLMMKMVEQNQISLDDKIAKWYPNLENANLITLKMLANGTSGIPDYVYNKEFMELNVNQPFRHWTEQEIIGYSMTEAPKFTPGTNQYYSHTDYVILGSILSKVGRKPLGELFQSVILDPLALKDTHFNLTATMPSPVLHAYSQDRKVYEDSTFWSPSWTSNSGAINSTIQDLGKWAIAWMNGSLLTNESTLELRAPDTVGKGNNKSTLYFAKGFAIANGWLFQNPSFNGYSGIFAVQPDEKVIFIAFNTIKESDKPDNTNYSMTLWQAIASELAPGHPLPEFK